MRKLFILLSAMFLLGGCLPKKDQMELEIAFCRLGFTIGVYSTLNKNPEIKVDEVLEEDDVLCTLYVEDIYRRLCWRKFI